jgi:hypothetical protein
MCSAVTAQGGAVMALLDRPIASAACLGIGSAFVAWSTDKQRVPLEPRSQDSPASARRALVLLAFAIVFTLAGLLPYMHAGGGGEMAQSNRSPAESAGRLGGEYKGVILVPEPAPHAVLVPPLPFLRHDLFAEKRPNPLSVPFFGVYWLFRWPFSRPPPDAYVAKGNPLKSVFRSSDRIPLRMEAHQNFGTLIDLSCCSEIQLAVRSAEETIALELILTNTTLPGKPSVSLGQVSVGNTTHQLLSFDVPLRPRIREFDEATIVFHRAFQLASAKVAIERFVFVPRRL